MSKADGVLRRPAASPQYLRLAAPRAARPPDGARRAARHPGRLPGAVGGAAASADHQSAVHQLSVGDLADLPRTAEGDAAAGQHPDPHLVDRARDRGRLHRRDGARHRDCRGAVVVARPLQGARPVSGRGQRHAEDRLRADLLHLARRDAVDLRHVACDLAVHHRADDLQRLPGHRSEQDQARADVRRDARRRF